MAEKRSTVCTFCLKSIPRYNSKSLFCGHCSCDECHRIFLKTEKSCPKCRKPIPLPRAAEGSEYSDYIDVTVETNKETVEDEDEKRRSKTFDRNCSLHDKVVEFFCYSCNLPACSQCLLTTHKIRDHDVASFADFAKETMKENIKKLTDLKALQTKLAGDISHSRMVIQKDGGKIKQLILEAHREAEEKIMKEKDILLNSLKRKEEEAGRLLSTLQDQHLEITSKLLSTRNTCQTIERDLGGQTKDMKNQFSLETIDRSISEIKQKIEGFSNFPLPEHLGLSFIAHRSEVFIGSLRDLPRNEDYSQLRGYSTWTAKKEIEIGELSIDYSSIVCMSSDWVVHISSLEESQFIVIRHYSLDEKFTPRKQMHLSNGSCNWTAAKDSGQNQSILIASGQNVYRISFRKIDREETQTFKIHFSTEAISWDKYKVDCFILSNNLRDVHKLSMADGKTIYLCSIKSGPQSVSSLTVNQDFLQLLDRTAGSIHVTSYVTSDRGEKVFLQQISAADPQSPNSESMLLSPHSMVTTRGDLGSHFVLFNRNGHLTVGSYNNKFSFIQWVIREKTDSEGNLIDISVRDDNLAVLLGTKIAMYKITSAL